MISCRFAAIISLLALFAGSAFAAEQVGSTVSAEDTVRGQGAVGDRVIANADPIYRDERIRSNATGLGQFQLGDGTKLVLGKNAQIVVDQYVTQGSGGAAAITLRAVSGSFRFITGASDHNAYKIMTPQGTLGVRGTAFEGNITATAFNLLLLNGRVWFCNRDAPDVSDPTDSPYCKWLDDPCDLLIANPRGPLTDPQTATDTYSEDELRQLFDIANREERLRDAFRLDSAACIGATAGSQGASGPPPNSFDPSSGAGGGGTVGSDN